MLTLKIVMKASSVNHLNLIYLFLQENVDLGEHEQEYDWALSNHQSFRWPSIQSRGPL